MLVRHHAAQVASLQREGVLVFSSVVDTQEQWKQALDTGFDAIFTNDPQRLLDFLGARQAFGQAPSGQDAAATGPP